MQPGDTKTSCREGHWSTGLYDCLEDLSNSSQIACGIHSALHMVHCTWLYTSNYRSQLRALFNLPEAPHADIMVHCCCCLCGICQEYRELKNRGVDPSIAGAAHMIITGPNLKAHIQVRVHADDNRPELKTNTIYNGPELIKSK
ncbi:Uncharacterized protein Fot_33564 [Forsythia ovata]|uniref:Uncharacterized protein n=1 Tax=Forsythia ovata TaxID=205694 RepID=A0ABD1TB27_9LAMI